MQKKKRPFVHHLAIYGCVSTGLIYLGIGAVAILSFLQIRDGGADESSLLAILNNTAIGYAFVCIILLGTLSYITWRIYEAIRDPYHFGKDWKGIATRTGIAISVVPDMAIAYSAITALQGTSTANEDGTPEVLRWQIGDVLEKSGGEAMIVALGASIIASAVIQLIYGVAKGYRERLDIDHMKKWKRNIIHYLAWAGYIARGIILGIIGFFFLKAGFSANENYIVNTDKAFDFIGDNIGHLWFILVAAGTICYGLFMFVFGMYYDTDRD